MKKVTLKNYLRVVNFSSPDKFQFDTGEILNGVSEAESRRLSLNRVEHKKWDSRGFYDVVMGFEIPSAVQLELNIMEKDGNIDIILVPFPMLKALGNNYEGKARSCILADRISQKIFSNKFSTL